MDLNEALFRVQQLNSDLERMFNAEQEVLDFAVNTVDTVIREAQRHLPPDDPLIASVREVMSPESVMDHRPIRVAELMLVTGQLEARLSSLRNAEMAHLMSEPIEAPPAFRMSDEY
jgi:hypothetical protein